MNNLNLARVSAKGQVQTFCADYFRTKGGSSKFVIHGVTSIKEQSQWCEQPSYGEENK